LDTTASASRFQTTSWTLILRARTSRQELERFIGAYWRPVYAYLRRKGKSREDAADLTQGFVAKVIEDDLVGQANPDRGRFRSFLLKSLDHFVIDERRREYGRDGDRPVVVPEDPDVLRAAEPRSGEDPAVAFDRQWATTVLEIVVDRLRAACESEGLQRHWRVFEDQVLRKARGNKPAPVEELIEALGARDRDEIYSMLNSVKRKFRQILRDVVAETVDDSAMLDVELADLRRFLSI
jgi:DNA-directed RNA polymerase specialized sigma24 family protein